MSGRAANPTLAHYSAHAALYADLLASHDSAPACRRFLDMIDRPAPAILDLGCGAGRDLAWFRDAGARSTGCDGSPELASIAADRTGCPVHVLDLLRPGPTLWPEGAFDGIWAHHLFFHLPDPALPSILLRVRNWLRPGGVFYACDPTGDGMQGMADDGRYLVFRRPQSWKSLVSKVGFAPLAEWRRPEGLPRRHQEWLATLWQRI